MARTASTERPYVGRFAPSPTGPLHAGSLVAALASWLDARAHGGRWLVRIEDVDRQRCLPDMAERIVAQLAACGLRPDAAPVAQSARSALYQAALERLSESGRTYRCGCSRADVAAALAAFGRPRRRHAEAVYPGTCRHGLHGARSPAVRLRVDADGDATTAPDTFVDWRDRWLGDQRQNLTRDVGDFVLRRGDGDWAYQLAVVVDDAAQGVTDVVRGADLADNTPRQILLQRLLGLPTPRYLHVPLVRAADGQKLSKQTGATPLASDDALGALQAAGRVLGLRLAPAASVAAWLDQAVVAWGEAHA